MWWRFRSMISCTTIEPIVRIGLVFLDCVVVWVVYGVVCTRNYTALAGNAPYCPKQNAKHRTG